MTRVTEYEEEKTRISELLDFLFWCETEENTDDTIKINDVELDRSDIIKNSMCGMWLEDTLYLKSQIVYIIDKYKKTGEFDYKLYTGLIERSQNIWIDFMYFKEMMLITKEIDEREKLEKEALQTKKNTND